MRTAVPDQYWLTGTVSAPLKKVGEIAEEQTGGTFSFICPAGLQGIKLTDPWYIEIDTPKRKAKEHLLLL